MLTGQAACGAAIVVARLALARLAIFVFAVGATYFIGGVAFDGAAMALFGLGISAVVAALWLLTRRRQDASMSAGSDAMFVESSLPGKEIGQGMQP